MVKKILKKLPYVFILLGVVAIGVGSYMIFPDLVASNSYKNLSEKVMTLDKSNNEEKVDWEVVEKEIPSTQSWLKIDGTSVNNPVAQATEDNPEFYLTHDIWGNYSQSGTLFFDEGSSPNTKIIYGHKMIVPGLMFNEIGDMHYQNRFNELGDALLWTKDGGLVKYKPVAATIVQSYDSDIKSVPSMNDEDRNKWAEDFYANALAKSGQTDLNGKDILFCVTCSGYARYGHDARTIVMFARE